LVISSLSKISNASAFADFHTKNQFTPSHAQRRAGLPHVRAQEKLILAKATSAKRQPHLSENRRIFGHNDYFGKFLLLFLEQTLNQ